MTDEDLSLFKSDVSKAHRRIKIRRQDWKYMIATIKNLFGVNMVGTYEFWSRVAAMLTRLPYHISEEFLWIMVLVDDFMLLLRKREGLKMAGIFMFLCWSRMPWAHGTCGWDTTWTSPRPRPGYQMRSLPGCSPCCKNCTRGASHKATDDLALGPFAMGSQGFPYPVAPSAATLRIRTKAGQETQAEAGSVMALRTSATPLLAGLTQWLAVGTWRRPRCDTPLLLFMFTADRVATHLMEVHINKGNAYFIITVLILVIIIVTVIIISY